MRLPIFLFTICMLLSSCSAVRTLKLAGHLKKGEMQAGSFSKRIAFSSANGLILLPVVIHGRTYTFVLDTGASPSLISQEVATALGLKTRGKTPLRDSQGNSRDESLILLDSLNIGGINFYDIPCVTSDLGEIGNALCANVDGIIGSSLMRKAIWAFDFGAQSLLITNDATTLPVLINPEKINFTTSRFDYTPAIDVTIDGEEFEEYLNFDMGSSGGIQVGRYVIAQHADKDFLQMAPYSTGNSGIGLMGKGNIDTTFYAFRKQVSIGATPLDSQLITYKKTGPSTIGMRIIRNYDLVINWFDGEITLSKKNELTPGRINLLGFNYSFKGGHCLVSELFKNSNAERAGLRLNDTILNINDRKYAGLDKAEQCELMRMQSQDNMDSVHIVIKRTAGERGLTFIKG